MQKAFQVVPFKHYVIGRLYSTNVCVVDRENRTVTFNSGGWHTRSTTKAIKTTLVKANLPDDFRTRNGTYLWGGLPVEENVPIPF